MGKKQHSLLPPLVPPPPHHHQTPAGDGGGGGGKTEAVLDILRKQSQLTLKQEKYCNKGCVERFLRSKGGNVKKAAKALRTCLSWRQSIGIEHLIADEFSAELAEGAAYVAGHDDDSRPVVIFRIKQDYHKFHSQKLFTRFMVFTLEVAISSMPKNVEQFVLLFDASFFRSGSAFLNLLLPTLKIVADYYPARLHRAFLIDVYFTEPFFTRSHVLISFGCFHCFPCLRASAYAFSRTRTFILTSHCKARRGELMQWRNAAALAANITIMKSCLIAGGQARSQFLITPSQLKAAAHWRAWTVAVQKASSARPLFKHFVP